MGWILGSDVAAESNHLTKSAGTLIDRLRQSSPLDCNIGANVVFPSFIREDGKSSQEAALAFKLEPASTAHSQVGLHSFS
jgi:hypothetical protein